MKAAWYERQGPPSSVLVVGEMTTPEPGAGEVRIRVAASQQVVPGLFVMPTGMVDTFLIDAPDGCVLVDAGLPGRDADILRGVADIKKIVK